jgi:hypothetical protein
MSNKGLDDYKNSDITPKMLIYTNLPRPTFFKNGGS